MENIVLESLKKCRDDAVDLENAIHAMDKNDAADEGDLEMSGLMFMAKAMMLDDELEKCEAFLNEESPEEVTEVYFEAQDLIERLLSAALAEIARNAGASKEFSSRLEAVSSSSESSGLTDDLLKLYKCESLIRMAYRSAQKFPIYGMPDSISRMEEETVIDQEQYILDKTGIDVCELRDVRSRLLESVRGALTEKDAE